MIAEKRKLSFAFLIFSWHESAVKGQGNTGWSKHNVMQVL